MVTIRKKVFAALKKSAGDQRQSDRYLAHTIKGYGMGDTAEGKTSLTGEEMNMDGVRYVRDRFNVPVADADIENCRT